MVNVGKYTIHGCYGQHGVKIVEGLPRLTLKDHRDWRLKPAEGLNQAFPLIFPMGLWVGFPLARRSEPGGSFWGFKQLFHDGLMRVACFEKMISLSLSIYIYLSFRKKNTNNLLYLVFWLGNPLRGHWNVFDICSTRCVEKGTLIPL